MNQSLPFNLKFPVSVATMCQKTKRAMLCHVKRLKKNPGTNS